MANDTMKTRSAKPAEIKGDEQAVHPPVGLPGGTQQPAQARSPPRVGSTGPALLEGIGATPSLASGPRGPFWAITLRKCPAASQGHVLTVTTVLLKTPEHPPNIYLPCSCVGT